MSRLVERRYRKLPKEVTSSTYPEPMSISRLQLDLSLSLWYLNSGTTHPLGMQTKGSLAILTVVDRDGVLRLALAHVNNRIDPTEPGLACITLHSYVHTC
jgi:hypothetical protein